MAIRIRGWHAPQKKMFYPEEMAEDQLTLLPTGQFINVHSVSTRLSTIYPLDKFIPMLSTNMKDFNKKEIWKGDILIWCSPSVKGKWVVEETSGGWNPFIDNMTTDKPYRYQVIGNIYENPELLDES